MNESALFFLSHALSSDVQGYGGLFGFKNTTKTSLQRGDSSNSNEWTLSNHIGTHVDVPHHFFDQGKTVESFSAGQWVFESPFLIDYKALAGELIMTGLWAQEIPLSADLLLLRTGFQKYRAEQLYWENNPGLTENLGTWLRVNRPNLRAIGVDIVSASSWKNRQAGRLAHQAFLNPEHIGSPIIIIEDMDLAGLISHPIRVTVAPLRVIGADAAPVTVIAEGRNSVS
jgi:arylformamidase